MKRLFCVTTTGSKKPVDDKYFESKQEAKAFRNKKMGNLLTEAPAEPKERCKVWEHANAFHISRGPDHIQTVK